jgi:transcriptional regulator with XRE-family HTH domain
VAVEQHDETLGDLLRGWRRQRRMSQLDLALEAEISARHLSFVETGRSKPSREMVLRLATHLGVPMRGRNRLLLAAGYAPVYGQSTIDSPELAPARQVMEELLAAHEPYPALVADRHSELVGANRSMSLFTDGAARWLLEPPVNTYRLGLHPEGMAPRIANFPEWSRELLGALRQAVAVTGDEWLAGLYKEVSSFPGVDTAASESGGQGSIAVPLRFRTEDAELAFFGCHTHFRSPLDVTVSELSIEAFYPADPATRAWLNRPHLLMS